MKPSISNKIEARLIKKILIVSLLLNFSIFPARADSGSEEIDWTSFDFSQVMPDDYTIRLADMYLKLWNHFEPLEVKTQITNSSAPDFDSSIAQQMGQEYEKALNFFGVNSANLYFFSEKTHHLFPQKMLELDGWYNSVWLARNCTINPTSLCGLATDKNNFYHLIGSSFDNEVWQRYVAHHESAHAFQNSYGLTRPERNNRHPNCWISEGQAEALGFASFVRENEIDFHRDHVVRNTSSILGEISKENKARMIDVFRELQNDLQTCFRSNAGYSVGVVLMEYLYITFSVEQVHNMIKDIIANRSLETALIRNMKIGEAEFYSNAFDYLIESYERSSK